MSIVSKAFNSQVDMAKMALKGTASTIDNPTKQAVEQTLADSSVFYSMLKRDESVNNLASLQKDLPNSLGRTSNETITNFMSDSNVDSNVANNMINYNYLKDDFTAKSSFDTARFRYGSANGKGGYNLGLMQQDSAKFANAMIVDGVRNVGIKNVVKKMSGK